MEIDSRRGWIMFTDTVDRWLKGEYEERPSITDDEVMTVVRTWHGRRVEEIPREELVAVARGGWEGSTFIHVTPLPVPLVSPPEGEEWY